MKKKILAAAVAAITCSTAQADFLRVEGGAGVWQAKPTGTLTYRLSGSTNIIDAADDLGYESANIGYLWLMVKHPVPVVPNVRVEYVDPVFEGKTKKGISWAGGSYGLNSYSRTEVEQTDVVLYYNLLDNTFWATLDLGLDVKLAKFSYAISDPTNLTAGYDKSASLAIPLLYARTRAQVPGTGLGLEADLKYISAGSSTVYDFRAKVDYTFDFVPVVQPAIELGYRQQKFTVDESKYEVKTDVDFSGVYAGVMLRF